MGGINNIGCEHLQEMLTNLLQKHWEWQENREPMTKHGSVVRPTMFVASVDIKTAFEDARPQHVAKIKCGYVLRFQSVPQTREYRSLQIVADDGHADFFSGGRTVEGKACGSFP